MARPSMDLLESKPGQDGKPLERGRVYAKQLKEGENFFEQYEYLRDLPNSDKTLSMLRTIAEAVKPIMSKHNLTVFTLAEFLPPKKGLLGLNMGGGQQICIRLRHHYDHSAFLTWDESIEIMIHELCHNVHGPHDRTFWKWHKAFMREYALLRDKGLVPSSFKSVRSSGTKDQVKSPVPSPVYMTIPEMRKKAREDAKKQVREEKELLRKEKEQQKLLREEKKLQGKATRKRGGRPIWQDNSSPPFSGGKKGSSDHGHRHSLGGDPARSDGPGRPSGTALGARALHDSDCPLREITGDRAVGLQNSSEGCASGRKDAEYIAWQAGQNSFRSKADEDDANDRAIMQALFELIQEEEYQKAEGISTEFDEDGQLRSDRENGLYGQDGAGCGNTHGVQPSEEEQMEWAVRQSVQSMSISDRQHSGLSPRDNTSSRRRASENVQVQWALEQGMGPPPRYEDLSFQQPPRHCPERPTSSLPLPPSYRSNEGIILEAGPYRQPTASRRHPRATSSSSGTRNRPSDPSRLRTRPAPASSRVNPSPSPRSLRG